MIMRGLATLCCLGSLAASPLSAAYALNSTNNLTRPIDSERDLQGPFDPDRRPDYDLKRHDEDNPVSIPLYDATDLILSWGSQIWDMRPGSFSPVLPRRMCLRDDALCLFVDAPFPITHQTEMSLIFDAFYANLDANSADHRVMTFWDYSYMRRESGVQALIATVGWMAAEDHIGNASQAAGLSNSSSLSVPVANPTTTSNTTELQDLLATNMALRIQWYRDPKISLSALAWHLITFLRNTVWAHEKDQTMQETDWGVDTTCVSPEHENSIFSLDTGFPATLRWSMIEDVIRLLWHRTLGELKGGFKGNFGVRVRRDVDYLGYVNLRAVDPVVVEQF